jgi:hypothetical protein
MCVDGVSESLRHPGGLRQHDEVLRHHSQDVCGEAVEWIGRFSGLSVHVGVRVRRRVLQPRLHRRVFGMHERFEWPGVDHDWAMSARRDGQGRP